MHIMHNLWNPRCAACTKCRDRQSDRPLKSCHIDHPLWNHGSSLTFMRGKLIDHFPWRGWMQSTWSACSWWSALISYVHGGSLSAALSVFASDISGRYVREIVHGHAHVQTDQGNFCACTCAHIHKTDLPIASRKLHARSFIDTHETRFVRGTFFIAAHRLKFLWTLHKKIEVMCIITQHRPSLLWSKPSWW
jgi:hypothetical protein